MQRKLIWLTQRDIQFLEFITRSMNTLIITYQLDNSTADYSKIATVVQKYEFWNKPFNRTWLIRTRCTPIEVRNTLRDAIGGEGRILVMDVSKSAWATSNVPVATNEWLHGVN